MVLITASKVSSARDESQRGDREATGYKGFVKLLCTGGNDLATHDKEDMF